MFTSCGRLKQSYILRAETKTLRNTSLLVVVEMNETIGSSRKSGVILLLNCGFAVHTSTASLGGREYLLVFSGFLIFNFPTALEITEAPHQVQRTDRAPIHLASLASRKLPQQKGRLPFCPLWRTTLDGMAGYHELWVEAGTGQPWCVFTLGPELHYTIASGVYSLQEGKWVGVSGDLIRK